MLGESNIVPFLLKQHLWTERKYSLIKGCFFFFSERAGIAQALGLGEDVKISLNRYIHVYILNDTCFFLWHAVSTYIIADVYKIIKYLNVHACTKVLFARFR